MLWGIDLRRCNAKSRACFDAKFVRIPDVDSLSLLLRDTFVKNRAKATSTKRTSETNVLLDCQASISRISYTVRYLERKMSCHSVHIKSTIFRLMAINCFRRFHCEIRAEKHGSLTFCNIYLKWLNEKKSWFWLYRATESIRSLFHINQPTNNVIFNDDNNDKILPSGMWQIFHYNNRRTRNSPHIFSLPYTSSLCHVHAYASLLVNDPNVC